jgi:hypothetical protein
VQLEALEDRLTPTTAISFANHVLTINVGADSETARLSESGGNLSILSNDAGGTTADAGAQALGFGAATGQNVANTGSIAAAEDVRLINVTGAAGTQTVNIAGGTFTAMNIADGLIENVSFLTAPSAFSDISGNGTADVAVLPTNNLTIGQSVTTLGSIALGTGQPAAEAAGATLTASSLVLQGAGSYALNNVNDVGTLAALTTGAISFNNGTNALTIGSHGSVVGIAATSDVTITADSLTLVQPIAAGAGLGAGKTVTLTAAGSIVASNADPTAPLNKITSSNLALSSSTGTGSAALPLATTITNLVAQNSTSGGIFVANSGSLTIGFVGNPFQGVTDQGNLDPISVATGTGGVFTLTLGTQESVQSNGGDITISADSLVLGETITTGSTSAGAVTLRQASTSKVNIVLGTNPSPGNLGISQGDLNRVTANFLRIGRTDNPGDLQLTASITQPTTVGSGFSLLSGGQISENRSYPDTGYISATNLRVEAATGVNLSSASAVQVAAFNSTSGQIQIIAAQTIGTVDGLSGVTDNANDGGMIEIGGVSAVSQPVSGTGPVFLSGSPTLNAPITGSLAQVNGASVTVNITGSTPLSLQGSTFVINFGALNAAVNLNVGASFGGFNTATLNSNATDSLIAVSATQVKWNNSETVNYGNLTILTIDGGNASNVFNIVGTAFNIPLAIKTGAGPSEVVNVGSAHTTLASFLSLMTILGQGTTNTMNILDQGDTTGQTYNLSDGHVSDAVAINFGNFNNLTVIGGSAGDSFNITPSPNTQFSVEGNNPTPPSFGDKLSLNLIGITNATLVNTFDPASGYSGTWSFGNAKPVAFQTIETLTPAPVVITSANAATFVTGLPGTFLVTTNGSPTATLTETGALPAGVTFVDNQNGTATLFGTPVATGAFPFTIKATNSAGTTSTQNFTLTVNAGTTPFFTTTAATLQYSPARFAPNPTKSPTVALVQGFYNNILGRAGDDAGINQWVSALQSGVASAQVVAAFWNSTEHRQNEVNSYYRYYLGRGETAADQQAWVTQLQNGVPENNVVLQFLSSPEYSQIHVANADFVNALYLQILGRNADASGLNAFVQSLAAGASRSSVAADILFSSEANGLAINGYYLTALARQGSPVDIQSWLQLVNGGLPLGNVAQDFLASDEYALDAKAST